MVGYSANGFRRTTWKETPTLEDQALEDQPQEEIIPTLEDQAAREGQTLEDQMLEDQMLEDQTLEDQTLEHHFHQSAAPVTRDLPDSPDPKELQVRKVMMEPTAKMDPTDAMPKSSQRHMRSHALSAPLDPLAHKAPLDPKAHQDPRVRPESPHAMECPETREWQANPDLLVSPDAKDPVELPDSPADSSPYLDLRLPQEPLDHPETKVQRDSPAQPDSPSKVHPEGPEMREKPDARVAPARVESQDRPDRMETRAAATIAPSPVPRQATSPRPEDTVVAAVHTHPTVNKCDALGLWLIAALLTIHTQRKFTYSSQSH